VTYFVLGIWRGKENPIWHEITDLKDDSITLLKSYDSPFDGALDREFINTVRQNFVDIDGWYIPTDLDEFHVFPKHENIKSLIDEMNRTQSDFCFWRNGGQNNVRWFNTTTHISHNFYLGTVSEEW